MDLMTNIPFFLGTGSKGSINPIALHFIKYSTLLRIFRLSTLVKYCENIVVRWHVNDKYLEVFKIILYWILGIHWSACLSIAPGNIVSKVTGKNRVGAWYESGTFSELGMFGKYISCVFKSIKTLLGTGFLQDLKATMYFDKVYASTLSFVGNMSLYITTARIFQIVSGLQSSSLKYVEIMVQLDKYLSRIRLPETTKEKLRTNYDYMFCKRYFNEQEILRTIPLSLRQEVMVHNTKNLVEKSLFFANLPTFLIMRIISVLSIELYFEGDVIFDVGEVGTAVYFITSGTVAMYTPNGREIYHITDGEYFGEMLFLSEDYKYRFAKTVAVEMTECYK